MVGRVDPGTALGSGAVDAQFWALVCEDEEWLDAEFAGIVSGPAESRNGMRRRPGLSADQGWPHRSPCPKAGPWGVDRASRSGCVAAGGGGSVFLRAAGGIASVRW
jgi:hypothetical protein